MVTGIKNLGLRSNHHIFHLLLAVQYNMSKVCILVVNNTLDLKKEIGGRETFFVGFINIYITNKQSKCLQLYSSDVHLLNTLGIFFITKVR